MSETIQNKAYLRILNDTLYKKKEVLEKLREQTFAQAELIKAEELNLEAFDATIEAKDKLIERLNQLEDGFMDIYNRAFEEVKADPTAYRTELAATKKLIPEITDLSTRLEAEEERNKVGLSVHLQKGKQRVKEFKVSSKTATAYYKNMSNHHKEGDSYFIDKKK